MDAGWDWDDITVQTGEWWLFLLGLLALLAGLGVGYLLGQQTERKRWARTSLTPPPPSAGPLP